MKDGRPNSSPQLRSEAGSRALSMADGLQPGAR